MLKLTLCLFLSLLTFQLRSENHKIQIMLTNPRTVSTAFEKSMMARGDHKVFHEPWVSSYMYHSGNPDVFSQLPPQELIEAKNYEEVKALIYRYAAQKPVFLKDMIWCMGKEILQDDALLSDPNVVLIFLIRDPALSIESFFMKGMEKMPVDRILEFTPAVFRYQDLVPIAEKYRAIRGIWPVIVEAEDLCTNPHSTMKAFCTQAGINYLPAALSWEEGMPEEWKHLATWHLDAADSKGFFIPKRDEIKTRFSLVPQQYAPYLESIYQNQKPHYEALKKMKSPSN